MHARRRGAFPDMAIATLSSFVEMLVGASILEIEQRDEVVRIQDRYQSSRELAQELLHREWITAFQANQILQGKGQELQFGSFTLLERIGEGGMGQVYKARQRGLNRVVALKVIRRECLGNSKAVARFQREIRLAGQLAHPHIVRAYDADQVDGAYYIAMEFIDGVDLANFVKKHGPLNVSQACDYIRQAALGLQYAYERGLVHRDIKPANLLVTQRFEKTHASSARVLRPNLNDPRGGVIRRADFDFRWGMVKVLDLGLARWTDPDTGRSATQLTQLGSVMGTPEFIAPEQARDSHKIDIRADLYSLGCTLYFLLCGQVPFPNGSLTEKLMQHQLDVPESVSVVRRRRLMRKGTLPADGAGIEVPFAIEEVVRRLMAKKPDDRHDTPAALAYDLSNLIDQLAKGTLPAAPRLDTSAVTEEVAAIPPEAPGADKSFDLKLESSTLLDKPIVAVKRQSKLATRGLRAKIAFVAVGMLAVLAGLMVAVASSRSSRPSAAEPPPKNDDSPWKKTVPR
jgi:serine/threonine protein kinase